MALFSAPIGNFSILDSKVGVRKAFGTSEMYLMTGRLPCDRSVKYTAGPVSFSKRKVPKRCDSITFNL